MQKKRVKNIIRKGKIINKDVINQKLLSAVGPNSVSKVGSFLVSSTFIVALLFLLNTSVNNASVNAVTEDREVFAALSIASLYNFDFIKDTILSKYDLILNKFVIIFHLGNKNGKNIIVIEDGKYSPNTISIKLGETVTFKTKDGKPFWPASSLHPDHSIYSEFDPLVPIEPEDTWSFTFDKIGVWKFHDHLRPFLRGEIVVTTNGKDFSGIECMDRIENGEEKLDKQECWEFALADALEDGGAKEAFKLFAYLYETQPEFSQAGCHWYAHKIGDSAYGDYLSHKDFNKVQFPAESSYCGYGYYHGFLEHYLRDDPDFDKATEICEYLIENKSDILPRIRLNCYHALGHGFIMEPSDTGIWGDAHAFLEPGLNACRKLEKDDERMECFQGSFNVISDWMYTNQYGLKPNPEDPLELCREQANQEETLSCYYELSMKLTPHAKDGVLDFYNSYVKSIEDDRIADEIINPFMASMMQPLLNNNESQLTLLYECRSLPSRVQVACLKGITGGFVAHGEPEKEYIKAIDFCSSTVLTLFEKDICYWNIIRTFKGVYTEEKMGDVCLLVEDNYKHYCEENY